MTEAYQKFLGEMGTVLEAQKANIKEDDEMASTKLQQAKNEANAFALYVKSECQSNPDFAKQVNAEWKSAQRMMNFVQEKAKKLLRSGSQCVMVDDHTVFDWVSDYYFLDDREEVEAKIKAEKEAKEKAEMEAKIKAEAEAKAKAEAEEVLADDEAYQNASDEEKEKLLKTKVAELQKKAERKAKAEAKKAKKAAEERSKAIKRLEEAGAITDSTSDTEKEKMIEQTIKKIRKEEREAKKKAKEEKAKKEAEKDTSIEANAPTTKTEDTKSEDEVEEKAEAKSEEPAKQEKEPAKVDAQTEQEGETKPFFTKKEELLSKARTILSKCRATEVLALYKRDSLESLSEKQLDNLVSHEAQVLERFGK